MKKNSLILIFTFLGILSIGLLFLLSSFILPFSADSISYISLATSLKNGQGLVATNLGFDLIEQDVVPFNIFGPGYSFLITLFSFTGLDLLTAAILIPRLFFILLPLAFFFVFKRMMTDRCALIVAFVCTFMFSVVRCSLVAWSDIPFLFFVLVSLCTFFKAIDRQKLSIALLAGLLAGYALLIRHVGFILVFSCVAGLTIGVMLKILSKRNFFKISAVYGLGVGIMYVPYLIRNILVFGSFLAYPMSSSKVALMVNIKDALSVMTAMFLGSDYYVKIFTFFLIGIGVFFVGKTFSLLKQDHQDRKKIMYAVILAVYAVSGCALVVAAHTKYYFSERINDRYLMQYAWVVLVGLTILINAFLKKTGIARKTNIEAVALFLLLGFLSIQIFPASDYLVKQSERKMAFQRIEKFIPQINKIPDDYVLISNVADFVQILTGRHVRWLSGFTPYGLHKIVGQKRPFAVIISSYEIYKYVEWHPTLRGFIHARYRVFFAHEDMAILTYRMWPLE